MKCINKWINGRVRKSNPQDVKVKLGRCGKFLNEINVIIDILAFCPDHDSYEWHPDKERKPTDKEGTHQKAKAKCCPCLFDFTSVLLTGTLI